MTSSREPATSDQIASSVNTNHVVIRRIVGLLDADRSGVRVDALRVAWVVELGPGGTLSPSPRRRKSDRRRKPS